MVLLDVKKETSSSVSPLNTAPPEQKEGVLSFSALLKGKETTDDKIIQNGTLILSLKDEKIPAKTLLDKNIPEAESLELDPKITALMTPKELKVLIKEAKEFLKNKIVQSQGFKKAEIDVLPKTLHGLVQVAKKIGIDISKITLEEVKADLPKTNLKDIKSLHVKPDSKTIKPEKEQKESLHVKPDSKTIKPEKEQKESLHVKSDSKTIKPEKESLHVKKVTKQETAVKNEDVAVDVKGKKQKIHTEKSSEVKQIETETNFTKKEVLRQDTVKSTPLFKAQNSRPEITTQQIVDTKVNHLTSQKTQKQKSDDTLKLLLRGEKVSKNDIAFTADFSIATAKVIAPHVSKEADKSLESLLKKSTKKIDDVQIKTDGMQVAKADSFEVKLNEAKQMVKYLSQDVKSAIEDYKSPFTRVKVQLHPQKLGEIDLTVVQRGKNLHINLSSNNAAINTLAMNVNDLKVQLNNNGINNASFNFNSNPQGDNSQAGQQQRQQQRQADEEYNYFDSQERKEESVNSLEIIVPHYA